MITVNLFDEAFRHLTCSVHGKTAKRIQYVRDSLQWDGITVYTDTWLLSGDWIGRHESRVKVGWLLEPREYKPEHYKAAERALPYLDYLLTHDQALLDAHPDKARFVPFGGCWIQEQNFGMHKKTKRISHIYSAKQFMPGHRIRHGIARMIKGELDCYGRGTWRPVEHKEQALQDYQFSIVVENSKAHNFFTEKLLDCFALGTIPIYWGCPNIGNFFDMDGIVTFDNLGELVHAISRLDYERHRKAADRNLELMRQYEITDDWIAENILEGL